MIRLVVQNTGINASEPETVRIRRVNPKSLILMVNRLKWQEDPPDGRKRWIVVNGVKLTREQIDSQSQYDAGWEWASLLLDELALAAAKRRTAARQERADRVSGMSKALKFGL